MKTVLRALCAAGLLASGSAGFAQSAEAQLPPPVLRCTDFLAIPDNTFLPETFRSNGFRFKDAAGGFTPFVNVFPDLAGAMAHGMQFDDVGLRIQPPKAAQTVQLVIGAFATPINITAYDVGGGIQDTAFVPADNLLHNIGMAAATARITRIEFIGGGFEGLLNSICTTP